MSAESGEVFIGDVQRKLLGYEPDEPVLADEYDDRIWNLISTQKRAEKIAEFLAECRDDPFTIHPLSCQILRSMGYNPETVAALNVAKISDQVKLNSNVAPNSNTVIIIQGGNLRDEYLHVSCRMRSREYRINMLIPLMRDRNFWITWDDDPEVILMDTSVSSLPFSLRDQMQGQHLGSLIEHPAFRDFPARIRSITAAGISLEKTTPISVKHLLRD